MKNVFIRTAALMAAGMIATPAFAGDLKIGGKMYFDYTSATVTKAASGTTKTVGGNVTRTYFSVKKQLDDTWSTAFKIDSAIDGGTKKSNNVFLKTAQLTGAFMPELNLKLGLIGTSWIGHNEHAEGHRYLSKTFVDTQGLLSSADAGVGVFGKIADGMVNYNVNVVNGGGYGNTTATNGSDIDARLGLAPIEGLTIDLGLYSGYRGSKKSVQVTAANPAIAGNKYTVTQLMVTYGMKHMFRVGANVISDKKTAPTAAASGKLTGLAVWGHVSLGDQFGGFVKYETAKLDKAVKLGKMTSNTGTEKRTVFSVDYKASKKVLLSLSATDVKNLHGISGDTDKVAGLYSQFKF